MIDTCLCVLCQQDRLGRSSFENITAFSQNYRLSKLVQRKHQRKRIFLQSRRGSTEKAEHSPFIPPEVCINIFRFIFDPVDLCNIALTCKQWNELINSNFVCKLIYHTNFTSHNILNGVSLCGSEKIDWCFELRKSLREVVTKSTVQELIYLSCFHGWEKILEKIVESKWENAFEFPIRQNAISPVQRAVLRNHMHILEILLQQGMDINRKGVKGRTVLIECILLPYTDYKEMLKFLLERGADPSIPDDSDSNILHYAVRNIDPNLVNMILESTQMNGANPSQKREFKHPNFINQLGDPNSFQIHRKLSPRQWALRYRLLSTDTLEQKRLSEIIASLEKYGAIV